MTDRFDLYAGVHKGLRHAMQATLLQLGQLDPSDASDVSRGPRAAARPAGLARGAPRRSKSTSCTPRSSAAPAALVVARSERPRRAHTRDFALLRTDAERARAAPASPVDTGRAARPPAVPELSRFVGENLVHMALEETEINALLWELFTDG